MEEKRFTIITDSRGRAGLVEVKDEPVVEKKTRKSKKLEAESLLEEEAE